ncbi:MAG: hypothetical protein QOJ33_1835, partial [Chloroflexota bacterium]|nr:hypothetical protein [Chloroflexota bacterium]
TGILEEACAAIGRDSSEIRRSVQLRWDGADAPKLVEQCARYHELGITEQVIYLDGEHPEAVAAKLVDVLPDLRRVDGVRS